MKVPVYAQGKRDIIDQDGRHVCFANTTEYRDDIVQAINRYDKLVEAIETFPEVHMCTCNCEVCLWFRTKARPAQDALKEVEK